MKNKQYMWLKVVATMVVAMAVSSAVVSRAFVIPMVVTAIAVVGLLYARTRVSEVVSDERDAAVGGIAALFALRLTSWIAIVAILALYAFRDYNPSYEVIAATLAYTICFLMLAYSIVFRYYERMAFDRKKAWYVGIAALVMAVMLVAGLRLFSGEDTWMCEDGAWVAHGAPSFPAPQVPCDK
jgi:uncharacterized membrane protein